MRARMCDIIAVAFQGEDNRKVCSLYLSLMDRFGVKLEQFGDAREHL